MNQEEGCTCRHKHREVTEERGLMNRLNRIEGQIRGIKSMVEDERYCVDIRRGDSDATVEELCRTLQKMMK